MPFDVSPNRDNEHPLIASLNIAIQNATDENKKFVLSCLVIEERNSGIRGIAEIIKSGNVDTIKAKELLANCGDESLPKPQDNMGKIVNCTVLGFVQMVLRHL